MQFHYIHTIDLTLACILETHGFQRRAADPITCIIEPGGHKQFTFWFEVSNNDERDRAKRIIDEYFDNRKRSPKGQCVIETDSMVSMQSAMITIRALRLDEMNKRVHPLVKGEHGDKVFFIGKGASQKIKDAVRKML